MLIPTRAGLTNSTAPTFKEIWDKLTAYGQDNEFSHTNYIRALALILTGEHYTFFTHIKGKPLAEIIPLMTDRFVQDHTITDCQLSLKKFARRPEETLRVAMARYRLLLERTSIVVPEDRRQARAQQLLETALLSLAGPKTREALNDIISTATRNGAAVEFDNLLEVAERAELRHDEVPTTESTIPTFAATTTDEPPRKRHHSGELLHQSNDELAASNAIINKYDSFRPRDQRRASRSRDRYNPYDGRRSHSRDERRRSLSRDRYPHNPSRTHQYREGRSRERHTSDAFTNYRSPPYRSPTRSHSREASPLRAARRHRSVSPPHTPHPYFDRYIPRPRPSDRTYQQVRFAPAQIRHNNNRANDRRYEPQQHYHHQPQQAHPSSRRYGRNHNRFQSSHTLPIQPTDAQKTTQTISLDHRNNRAHVSIATGFYCAACRSTTPHNRDDCYAAPTQHRRYQSDRRNHDGYRREQKNMEHLRR